MKVYKYMCKGHSYAGLAPCPRCEKENADDQSLAALDAASEALRGHVVYAFDKTVGFNGDIGPALDAWARAYDAVHGAKAKEAGE